MQQQTSKLLYDYWNSIRHDRIAPRRYEIEPMKIARILPETFILECSGFNGFQYRLAGTRLCEHFGYELRGMDILEFWSETDRSAIRSVLHRVVLDADVATITFEASAAADRSARFEMVILPLIHTGKTVNRMMGSIVALDPPFWLGSSPLTGFSLVSLDVRPPAGKVDAPARPDEIEFAPPGLTSTLVQKGERKFRVYDGGREDKPDGGQ